MTRRPPLEIIEGNKRLITLWKEKINNTGLDLLPNTYTTMGDSAKTIALHYCILMNKAEAMNWFREAVGYYIKVDELLKKDGKRIRYVYATDLLESVILLQDKTLYAQVSKIIEGLMPEPVPGTNRIATEIFEAYLDCMAAILREEYDKTLELLPRLKKWEEKDWKKCEFFPGVSGSIEGIATLNKDFLLEGLKKIMTVFKKRNAQIKNIPICIDATIIYILAKRRELDIKLEDIDERLRELIPEVLVS